MRVLHVDSGREYRGGQNQVRLLARELAREPEVQQLLVTKLKDKYLKEPQVVVTIRDRNSQKISVLGQVSKPGQVAYYPNMTIVDAIAKTHGGHCTLRTSPAESVFALVLPGFVPARREPTRNLRPKPAVVMEH